MNEKKIIEMIRKKMIEKKLTGVQFAKLVGWTSPQLSNFFSGKQSNITLRRLLLICKTLDITIQ